MEIESSFKINFTCHDVFWIRTVLTVWSVIGTDLTFSRIEGPFCV